VAYLVLTLVAVGLLAVVASSSRRAVLSVAILAFARSMDTTPLYAKIRHPHRPE
jgi:hypothetical protein